MIGSENGDAAPKSEERAVLPPSLGKKCRVARVLPISFESQEEHSHHCTNILPNNTVKQPRAKPSYIYSINSTRSGQPEQASRREGEGTEQEAARASILDSRA